MKKASYVKIGVIVGIVGAVLGIVGLAPFAGIPVFNVFLSLPIGVATGLWVASRYEGSESQQSILRESFNAALIAGAITTISAILPLIVLFIFQPTSGTAQLSEEFGRVRFLGFIRVESLTPSAVLDDIRIALPVWSVILATIQVLVGCGFSVLTTKVRVGGRAKG